MDNYELEQNELSIRNDSEISETRMENSLSTSNGIDEDINSKDYSELMSDISENIITINTIYQEMADIPEVFQKSKLDSHANVVEIFQVQTHASSKNCDGN